MLTHEIPIGTIVTPFGGHCLGCDSEMDIIYATPHYTEWVEEIHPALRHLRQVQTHRRMVYYCPNCSVIAHAEPSLVVRMMEN